ncbi:MAG TPA: hypothetical protein VEB64_11065 [Azospirillaceae bacterium]|nr:hypothetical protein [Azospirillaceae bacterium]
MPRGLACGRSLASWGGLLRERMGIRTGERGVLEYLLDPLLRYRQESLRER